MEKRHVGYRLIVLMPLWFWLLAFSLWAAAGPGSIRGILYVSYAGDLSIDVMYAKAVEVLLLKGDGDLEKELNILKGQRLPQIQAQEAAVSKARVEARRSSPTEEEKKQKQEALKREGEKLEKLRSEYNKDVDAMLAKYMLEKTKTNDEGRFRFEGLSPTSRYLLHARYELPGTIYDYFWLYPVELKEGREVEVRLNKAATVSLYK